MEEKASTYGRQLRKYTEYAVMDSRQWEILQFRG
jgi:hypothetical protein